MEIWLLLCRKIKNAMPFEIKNIRYFPSLLLTLLPNISRKKRLCRALLDDRLKAIEHKNGAFPKADIYKIHQIAWYISGIFGTALDLLRETPLNATETELLAYLGALTPLYDDFFDLALFSDNDIRTMTVAPFSYVPQQEEDRLFIEILRHVHNRVPDKKRFIDACSNVFNVQVEGRKQLQNIGRDEIRDITYKKGGYTFLFYSSVLTHCYLPGEEEAIYNLGGWIQLLDDIFDIREDRNHLINTLPTTARDIDELISETKAQMNHTFTLFRNLAYPKRNTERFLYLFYLYGIVAFSHLHHLKRLQTQSNNEFLIDHLKKDDLEWKEWKIDTVIYFLRHLGTQGY